MVEQMKSIVVPEGAAYKAILTTDLAEADLVVVYHHSSQFGGPRQEPRWSVVKARHSAGLHSAGLHRMLFRDLPDEIREEIVKTIGPDIADGWWQEIEHVMTPPLKAARNRAVRADITLGIHISGGDTAVDLGAVQVALEEHLSRATIYVGPKRSPFVIDSVDDAIQARISITPAR